MRKRIKNANIYKWYARLVFAKKNWGHKKKYSGIRDAKILCKSSLWKNSRVEGKFSKEGKNIKKIITILIEKKWEFLIFFLFFIYKYLKLRNNL